MSSSADMLDSCGDGCGWIAAIVAALAYGSFGVPIRQTKHINVHPLVFQSYKTMTMFVMSWLVILLHVPPAWTSWGILSGLLWVLGGTGGIYAIRLAGLATAVGTWASVMIGVNFVWGILVFQEPVDNVGATAGAFVLVALGLMGMSQASAQVQPPKQKADEDVYVLADAAGDQEAAALGCISGRKNSAAELTSLSHTSNNNNNISPQRVDSALVQQSLLAYQSTDGPSTNSEVDSVPLPSVAPAALFRDAAQADEGNDAQQLVVLFDGALVMSRRTAGIWGAVFNGLMTGSSLIPVHYAKSQGLGGAHYMISYATGALFANMLLWMVFFGQVMWNTQQQIQRTEAAVSSDNSVATPIATPMTLQTLLLQTYENMPDWHFRVLIGPGVLAGSLLALAMFSSILAVTYLGQGIGNSVVQTKLLVSGLWGIVWFREIRGCTTISQWFGSAALTLFGILWLSHERLAAVAANKGNDNA